MALLDDLNPQQREAVLAVEGPVLVLAGAGSGKTRVITYRVAHLVAQGVPAESILSVTFTNKAAEQMKQRISTLLLRNGLSAGDPWIGTFHAFCARLLRREAPRLDLRRDFAIYDDDDQTSLVKLALKNLGYEERSYPVRELLGRISHAKNKMFAAETMAAEAHDEKGRVVAKVYELYDRMLRQVGAVDFDDLLLHSLRVLRDFPEACDHWGGRFRHIQVDEYQDTNRIQYELVHLLSGRHHNLCVVGDEDQSIYSWRGADVGNILRFEEDFPGARLIRLEENYRSTQSILDAAGAVVKNNVRRIGKTLVATRGAGRNLRFFEAQDAPGEAQFVCEEIQRLLRNAYGAHVAVLYRTNFQSRAFEEVLRRMSIRYKVVGGFSFYQRAEIRDTMAYVRLAINPDDDVALLRVLNTPPRGIGKTTVEALRVLAQQHKGSLWAAIGATVESAGGRAAALRGFRELILKLQEELPTLPPSEFIEHVLDGTGYVTMLEQQDFAEDSSRVENVRELVNAVAEGFERGETLADFLDRTALVSDADDYDETSTVTLLTLHSAKGLEFDHVFLVGMEEGLFPHSRTKNSPDDLEEERRLCYVGMTRAKDSLTLTRATYRRIYGNELLESSAPSRFLQEIPDGLLETVAGSQAEATETRRYVPDPEFDAYSRRRYGGKPAYGSARGRPPARAPSGASRRGSANPLIGMRVRHKQYGLGTILAVEGEGEERKLTISFSDYGTKKLMERYANLERA